MKSITRTIYTEQPGFVLLFSLVVSTIIFFIGAGMFSIAFKELLVSSLSQESQKSVFAADSGVECALYGDKLGRFPMDTSLPQAPFGCLDETIQIDTRSGEYVFSLPFDGGTCAVVHVYPNEPNDGQKTIIAQGYNKCNDGEPVFGYAGLTERVYRVVF